MCSGPFHFGILSFVQFLVLLNHLSMAHLAGKVALRHPHDAGEHTTELGFRMVCSSPAEREPANEIRAMSQYYICQVIVSGHRQHGSSPPALATIIANVWWPVFSQSTSASAIPFLWVRCLVADAPLCRAVACGKRSRYYLGGEFFGCLVAPADEPMVVASHTCCCNTHIRMMSGLFGP